MNLTRRFKLLVEEILGDLVSRIKKAHPKAVVAFDDKDRELLRNHLTAKFMSYSSGSVKDPHKFEFARVEGVDKLRVVNEEEQVTESEVDLYRLFEGNGCSNLLCISDTVR